MFQYLKLCHMLPREYVKSILLIFVSNSLLLTETQFNPIPDSKANEANGGPSGADRTQVGPMLDPLTLLSGFIHRFLDDISCNTVPIPIN